MWSPVCHPLSASHSMLTVTSRNIYSAADDDRVSVKVDTKWTDDVFAMMEEIVETKLRGIEC
jgi:hypothetical protein